LTWNLQVNASAVTVKLIWIKADKPIGEVANQAHNKKNLPPSTRKWKRTPSKPVEGEKE
jgi:hypothetical protein